MSAILFDSAEVDYNAAPLFLFPIAPEEHRKVASQFDQSPFSFRHRLHEHPAFQLPALLSAAARMAQDRKMADRAHFESGTPEVNGWFGAKPEDTTLVEALASVKSGHNWIILKRIHQDPQYAAVLAEIVPQLSELTSVDIPSVYYDPTMTIFVTSPGRITPYHMDGETNFLAQIHGSKAAYLYDGNDKSVLSEAQMEDYWTGNLPKIDLPEALPFGHWQYMLEPGVGVFNPAIFPHWLQNGPDVSISVSINFKRRRNASIAAHRANHFLRRAGITPTPPGRSPGLDRIKEATFGRAYEMARVAAVSLKQRRRKS